jgi:hypothetical protein
MRNFSLIILFLYFGLNLQAQITLDYFKNNADFSIDEIKSKKLYYLVDNYGNIELYDFSLWDKIFHCKRYRKTQRIEPAIRDSIIKKLRNDPEVMVFIRTIRKGSIALIEMDKEKFQSIEYYYNPLCI